MLPWKVSDSATSLAPNMSITATTLGWSVQAGRVHRGGCIAGHQRKVSTGGAAPGHDLVGIEVVLGGVLLDPGHGTEDVLDGCGAGASMALRYWTATTLMPAAKNGPKLPEPLGRSPRIQPPPWIWMTTGVGLSEGTW